MALTNPECIGGPGVCSRSDAPTSGSQGTTTANGARNYVKHNSVENISQDLVHPTKSDTASASLFSETEEREEVAETGEVPAPAPAPTLETVEEQSHTPGSRKSMRKNLGRPASSYSDFNM